MKQTNKKEYLFYKADELTETEYPSEYTYELFEPRLFRLFPKVLSGVKNYAQLTYLFLKLGKYKLFLAREGKKIVATCVVCGKNKFYPFMGKDDVFVGPVETDKNYRRRHIMSGLICFIKRNVIATAFWWIVNENNTPSIRLCEKHGFKYFSRGYKNKNKVLMLYEK